MQRTFMRNRQLRATMALLMKDQLPILSALSACYTITLFSLDKAVMKRRHRPASCLRSNVTSIEP